MGARYNAPSRCSSAGRLVFRWYGEPLASPGSDIEDAVTALVECVTLPGRVWNPYALAMTKSEFRRRLKKASAGKLAPVDEVKPVDIKNPPPLYEIRWQDVAVTERLPEGGFLHKEVAVRMYHSEPPALPAHFIGLHAHEKDVGIPNVNAAQQAEINKAAKRHFSGASSNWGIV